MSNRKPINVIDENIEISMSSSQNLTTFSIPVGLHPKDADRISDLILKELTEGCEDTKRIISEVNETINRLNDTTP